MKLVSVKSVKIFTDGTVDFSFTCLKSQKQVVLYEKDNINSLFCQKAKKLSEFQNSLSVSYKSKYKV